MKLQLRKTYVDFKEIEILQEQQCKQEKYKQNLYSLPDVSGAIAKTKRETFQTLYVTSQNCQWQIPYTIEKISQHILERLEEQDGFDLDKLLDPKTRHSNP